MASIAAISEAFGAIHETLDAPTEAEFAKGTGHAELRECLSLCRQFGLTPEALAREWEAFCVNSSLAVSLDVAGLGKFKAQLERAERRRAHTPAPATRMLDRNSLDRSIGTKAKLTSLTTPVSASKRAAPPTATPEGQPLKVPRRNNGVMSPASSQSPSTAASYDTRENAGQRIAEWNLPMGHRASWEASSAPRGLRCEVGLGASGPGAEGHQRYRHMFTTLHERAAALDARLQRLYAPLLTNKDPELEECPLGVPRQAPVFAVGRVVCDADEGRLNKASVCLEASREHGAGRRVSLNLGRLPHFALFPGQVVGVEGVFAGGGAMLVQRVVEPASAPVQTTPRDRLLQLHHSKAHQGGKPVQAFVAAGPYTTSDNLDYQPLLDLLNVIRLKQPDVVVLHGPFVDARHPMVASGDTWVEGDAGRELVDVETLFQMHISHNLSQLFVDHPELPTQFVLLPSLHDAFHDFVFPQPPLEDRVAKGIPSPFFDGERLFALDLPGQTPGETPRVFCAPNPATFRLNEVGVAAVSTDVLFHVGCEEVSANVGNRLARLCHHLLQQRSLYPVFPPPADPSGGSPSQLDFRHAAQWGLEQTPDLLIVPSRLACFVKEVQGCLCLNPGQLAKGKGGGTFAVLSLHPMPEAALAAVAPETEVPHGVPKRTCVEILRI